MVSLKGRSPVRHAQLDRDVLFFGLAVRALLAARVAPGLGLAADWPDRLPSALLLHPHHPTAIHVHNTFDSYLGEVLWQFGELRYSIFRHRTGAASRARGALTL